MNEHETAALEAAVAESDASPKITAHRGQHLNGASAGGRRGLALPPDAKRYKEGGPLDFRDHPACVPLTIVDAAAGLVSDPAKRRKLAVVGFSTSTRDEAPFDDPSWVVAGLNQLNRYIPRADVWFEMHHRDLFVGDTVRGTDYVAWLKEQPLPVFMEPEDYTAGLFGDIGRSVRFPVEAANAFLGPVWRPRADGSGAPQDLDYWESSIAYMVQWGALVGFEEIGLWGVDMIIGEEYAYQKPNLEYYIGFAQGRGIKITLPEKCALLKQTPFRYGRRVPNAGPFTQPFFDAIYTNAIVKREQLITELNQVDGAATVIKNLKDAALIYARGGVLKDFGIVQAHRVPGGQEGSAT